MKLKKIETNYYLEKQRGLTQKEILEWEMASVTDQKFIGPGRVGKSSFG